MKFTKVLAASVVSTALVASMAVSASAATKDEAIAAASAANAPAENVQQLKNYLDANAAHYTAADYDDFVNTVNQVGQKYRGRAYSSLTQAEQADIVNTLVALGDRHNTTVTCTKLANGHYSVSAQWRGTTSNSSGSSSQAGGQQTAGGQAVANTGSTMAEESTSGAVAFAGLALVLAAAGVVVVTRKNRA